ncbi:unnamed protein product, partial [Sphacelaria rigidula]
MVEGKNPSDISLRTDNSQTFLGNRVDDTADALVKSESSYPELSVTCSGNDEVSSSSSKRSLEEPAEMATDWAFLGARINPENGDRLTPSRIVETTTSVDSRAARDSLEMSARIGSAGDPLGNGFASNLSVAPAPSSAASSVNRGCSPSQGVD